MKETMMERRYRQVPSIMKRQGKMLKKLWHSKKHKTSAEKTLEPAVELGAGMVGGAAGFMVAGVPGAAVGGFAGIRTTDKMFKKIHKKKHEGL